LDDNADEVSECQVQFDASALTGQIGDNVLSQTFVVVAGRAIVGRSYAASAASC
jgi:hypothetical protein